MMLDIACISFIINNESEENIMISYDQVSQIVFKEAKKAGYVVEERKSVSTSSVYYTVSSGKYSLLFRIADHKTKSNVITFRIDHKSSIGNLENFVKNRIKDLGYRKLKAVLGM